MRVKMRNIALVTVLGSLFLLMQVGAASAQTTGSIAGVVKDATGAVLPGVTVEATSPALIEKVRSVTTDGVGQYKIVDLRPGIYVVTFTLPGFSLVKHEGLVLNAGVALPVNAELKVGSVDQTVTVTGASPIVDVQNVTQHTVLTRGAIDNLPSGRSFLNLAVLIPGVTTTSQDVGGVPQQSGGTLAIHGSRPSEMPLLLDGIRYNNVTFLGGGTDTLYRVNTATTEEIAVEVSGTSAEASVSGVRSNVISKEGGNTIHGGFYGNYTNNTFQSSNLTDTLKAQVGSVPATQNQSDVSIGVGGPIMANRLWYFGALRNEHFEQIPPGAFYNANGPLALTYQPDFSKPGVTKTQYFSDAIRLTWQATPKNKFAVFFDRVAGYNWSGGSAVTAPEATGPTNNDNVYVAHALWRAPISNRLLLDGNVAVYNEDTTVNGFGNLGPRYSIVELSTGVTYHGPAGTTGQLTVANRNYFANSNLSYVSGSHALKIGMQLSTGYSNWTQALYDDKRLFLLNGVPDSVEVWTSPFNTNINVKADLALFAQDQWTIRRFTLNYGLRFEYSNAYVPALHEPPVQYVGARDFAEVDDAPNWKDISPRLGVAWDVAGDGKSVMKASLGRYTLGMAGALARVEAPVVSSINTTTRPWTDLNGDLIPQPSELGPLANQNFGKTIITTKFDPGLTSGWGNRPYNWEGSIAFQRQIRDNIAANIAYFRRWAGNFFVVQNLAVSPSDYNPYCITAPVDSRLPNGGGYQECGLYNISPSKFGQANYLVTNANKFGNQSQKFDAVDVSVNARLPRGIILQAGTSTGRQVSDNCDVVSKVNNFGTPFTTMFVTFGNLSLIDSPSPLFCHLAAPFQTQAKALVVYPLPWWGLQTSATFQSIPGPAIMATYVATNAIIAPSLGRNLSGGVTTASIQLIAPNTMFADRLDQLDARIARNFKLGEKFRLQAMFDAYNLTNSHALLGLNATYGARWLVPTSILPGRLLKCGAQLDF